MVIFSEEVMTKEKCTYVPVNMNTKQLGGNETQIHDIS